MAVTFLYNKQKKKCNYKLDLKLGKPFRHIETVYLPCEFVTTEFSGKVINFKYLAKRYTNYHDRFNWEADKH